MKKEIGKKKTKRLLKDLTRCRVTSGHMKLTALESGIQTVKIISLPFSFKIY